MGKNTWEGVEKGGINQEAYLGRVQKKKHKSRGIPGNPQMERHISRCIPEKK